MISIFVINQVVSFSAKNLSNQLSEKVNRNRPATKMKICCKIISKRYGATPPKSDFNLVLE